MFLVSFILNISLILALLVSPCLLLMAYGYRKHLSHTLLSWRRSEMVVITIAFAIVMLILFVVGVSCFFSFHGSVNTGGTIGNLSRDKVLDVSIICMLNVISLTMIYAAMRLVLVQIIDERGIVFVDRWLRIPSYKHLLEWHEICDYYLISDYPIIIYNFIVQKQPSTFERVSIRVPIYIREDFENLLEAKINSPSAVRARAQIGRKKFSEN